MRKQKMLITVFKDHNKKVAALVGNEYAAGTLTRYETSLRHTQSFLEWRYQATDINIKSIDHNFYDVMKTIDGNIAKLGKTDAKFFLVNISPSQKEIAFLKEQYGEQGAKAQLKVFAVKVMDAYAHNFKRDGINSHKDLVWFAKLENYRYYTYKDQEVNKALKNAAIARTESKCMYRSLSVGKT